MVSLLNYFYLTPKHFLLFMLLIYCFLLIIIFIKKNIYIKLSLKEYEKSPELLLIYLDKYYMKNKFVTFGIVIFYLLFKVALVLYLRYLYLGYEFYITRFLSQIYMTSPWLILKTLLLFILFIISIKSFYLLLYKIFFDEFVKAYLYIMESKFVKPIKNFLLLTSNNDIWGPFYLFFECIYRKTFTPDDYFYNDYYCYDYIYKYKYVRKLTKYLINLSEKYKTVFFIIKYARKLCHILYVHLNHENIFKIFPFYLLIFTIIYDFFNSTIYYTYYMLFIMYFLFLYHNFYNFIRSFDPIFIGKLHDYFYENTNDYSKQRKFLFDKTSTPSMKSLYDIALLYKIQSKDIIKHIYNEFNDKENLNMDMKLMELRFFITLILLLLNFYFISKLINNELLYNGSLYNIIITLLLLWYITVFCGRNTYKLGYENPNEKEYPIYTYQLKYNVIFWLLTLLQGYLFYKILFKPEILFMSTDVLFELPLNLSEIKKNYTNDDKIYYLFQYFENQLYKIPQVDQENLRYILRQIDFNYLINTENLTLKDIQVYVELLFDNYYLLNNFITEYINNIINEIQKVENESVPNELEMIIQKLLTNIAFCIFIQTLYSKL